MAKVITTITKINMKNNFEIIYMVQRFLVTIDTLYENIKLIIKYKRYDMTTTKSNILLTKIFIGQILNNSEIKNTISNENSKILRNPSLPS